MTKNHNNQDSDGSAKEKALLSDRVLQEIASKKVVPRPRWYFTCKNILLWTAGAGLLIVGALSASIIIFIVTGAPWDVRHALGESHVGHFIQIFPFLWLIALIAFLLVAEFVLTKTKGAYKHSPLKISLIIIVASIILGTVLHWCKVSSAADNSLGKHAPTVYKTLEQRRINVMHKPKKGRIMGIVQSIDMDGVPRTFVIMHPHKEEKITVNIETVPQEKLTLIQTGSHVIVIGKPEKKGLWSAFDIHPIEEFKRKMRRMLRAGSDI